MTTLLVMPEVGFIPSPSAMLVPTPRTTSASSEQNLPATDEAVGEVDGDGSLISCRKGQMQDLNTRDRGREREEERGRAGEVDGSREMEERGMEGIGKRAQDTGIGAGRIQIREEGEAEVDIWMSTAKGQSAVVTWRPCIAQRVQPPLATRGREVEAKAFEVLIGALALAGRCFIGEGALWGHRNTKGHHEVGQPPVGRREAGDRGQQQKLSTFPSLSTSPLAFPLLIPTSTSPAVHGGRARRRRSHGTFGPQCAEGCPTNRCCPEYCSLWSASSGCAVWAKSLPK